ncbi:hypothetical protein BRD15_08065 [Halobacteriales archaeon SW_6_65_15]|nr:MAG: hypothetical protein BRD15_08065 [Halobacteriales archaeon SW_6_65_15]
MSKRIAVLALVVCVVLAGCGGPGTENETTTETNADGTRAVALPPNETVAAAPTTGTTAGATQAMGLAADSPSPSLTVSELYSSNSSDSYR